MRVNVFISEVQQNGTAAQMLVLPYGPEATIPAHLQHMGWRHLAVAEADDKIIGLTKGEVEAGLARDGYLMLAPVP